MAKQKITPDRLRALIELEAEKIPGCDGLRDIRFFGTEDPENGNWTVAFGGITPGDDAKEFAAIIGRLVAAYDIQWTTVH